MAAPPSEALGTALARFLTEATSYDETVSAFTQLQTDVGDFIATLKHYKLKLPSEEVGEKCYRLTFDQVTNSFVGANHAAVPST